MEFMDVLKLRQSCRSYKPQQITQEQLKGVLDAAYLAPVGMGKYEDVQLAVVQDPEVLKTMNRLFAGKIGDDSAMPTYGAPTVVFILQREDTEAMLAGANASCIVENMLLAASSEGLGSCYLYGICRVLEKDAQVKEMLQIPDGFSMTAGVCIGIPVQEPAPRTVEEKMKTSRIG